MSYKLISFTLCTFFEDGEPYDVVKMAVSVAVSDKQQEREDALLTMQEAFEPYFDWLYANHYGYDIVFDD